MAARLQQLAMASLLLLAGAAGAWLWSGGHRVAALVTPGTILIGVHGAVLALEFAFMVRANRAEPAPAPSRTELVAAWWGEVLAAAQVFGWRQPFRHAAVPDHMPPAARGRRGVVLVHGYLCNRGLRTQWMRRLRTQGVPFSAVTLEPLFGAIESSSNTIERAVQQVTAATGLAPVIVAHSMGGLAVRNWLAGQQRPNAAYHVLTLGTPHHGTWFGRFATSRNARQMRLNSPWLRELLTRERERPPFTCYYSRCDNIVFPASTASLQGAENRHLRGVAHVAMVDHPEPFAALLRLL